MHPGWDAPLLPFLGRWGSRWMGVTEGITEGASEGVSGAVFGLLPAGVANARDYGSFRP